jgi:major membrane immunogen (membrane-anchored lipoprotein)
VTVDLKQSSENAKITDGEYHSNEQNAKRFKGEESAKITNKDLVKVTVDYLHLGNLRDSQTASSRDRQVPKERASQSDGKSH